MFDLKMSKWEWVVFIGMTLFTLFVIALSEALGQEHGRWMQRMEEEIEQQLPTLEDCSYVEQFRSSPEEQDARALCDRMRQAAKASRGKLEEIEMGERRWGVVGDIKRHLDMILLKVQLDTALKARRQAVGELLLRQQKRKLPPQPGIQL